MNWCDFFYCKDGRLFWKVDRNSSTRAGDEAGSRHCGGYRCVEVGGCRQYVHRVVWQMHNGPIPDGLQIDHINGIRSDNRIENLRVVTARENMTNMPLHRSGRLGGYTYHKRDKRWKAGVSVGHKKIHVGYFNTEAKAHEAYKKACDNIHLYDGDGHAFRRLVREALA